ncbi:MAG: hypothetical protein J5826_08580 [Bacteroidales bacterium]|nr:hypothetical protein [Bacteroidales bacterium]
MKKLYIFLTCAVMLCACGNKGGVSEDSLQGTYSIDISDAGSLFESEFKIPTAMVSSLLTSADLTVEFKDSKATIDAGTMASMLIKTATSGKYSLPVSLDFKIENDSVLYLKQEGQDFKEVGVVSKVGDNYDKLIYKPKYKSVNATLELIRQK